MRAHSHLVKYYSKKREKGRQSLVWPHRGILYMLLCKEGWRNDQAVHETGFPTRVPGITWPLRNGSIEDEWHVQTAKAAADS